MAKEKKEVEKNEEEGDAKEGEEKEGEGGSAGGKKKLIIIIVGVVVLGMILGGVAAFLLMGSSEESEESEEAEEEIVEEVEEKLPAIYIGVPNALTANIPGAKKGRTVQIKIVFVVRNEDQEEYVQQHMPQLKNDILMLLSKKTEMQLKIPEGRIKLQEEALAVVQETLTEMVGEPTIEKVLFVSFIMQ